MNINKPEDQDNANKINNAVLGINVVVVAINIIISAFDIKAGDQLNNSTASASEYAFNYSEPLLTSYNLLSDSENWSNNNVSHPDMDNSRLYEQFVQVFNKIKEIYLNNQTANMDSSFVLTNDNVNEFMDRILRN